MPQVNFVMCERFMHKFSKSTIHCTRVRDALSFIEAAVVLLHSNMVDELLAYGARGLGSNPGHATTISEIGYLSLPISKEKS